jgi:hypothetical protein
VRDLCGPTSIGEQLRHGALEQLAIGEIAATADQPNLPV